MHVLLNAKREGRDGHRVEMQLIVVGSARSTPGQTVRHSELLELAE